MSKAFATNSEQTKVIDAAINERIARAKSDGVTMTQVDALMAMIQEAKDGELVAEVPDVKPALIAIQRLAQEAMDQLRAAVEQARGASSAELRMAGERAQEAQRQLAQSQTQAQHYSQQCDELQRQNQQLTKQLQASQARVAELEQELAQIQATSTTLDQLQAITQMLSAPLAQQGQQPQNYPQPANQQAPTRQ